MAQNKNHSTVGLGERLTLDLKGMEREVDLMVRAFNFASIIFRFGKHPPGKFACTNWTEVLALLVLRKGNGSSRLTFYCAHDSSNQESKEEGERFQSPLPNLLPFRPISAEQGSHQLGRLKEVIADKDVIEKGKLLEQR